MKQTPLKSIRAKCLDCCGGSAKEVRLCPIPDCPLFPFRFGKNPNLQRKLSAAQMEALERGRIPFRPVDKLKGSAHNTPGEGRDAHVPLDARKPQAAGPKQAQTRKEARP